MSARTRWTLELAARTVATTTLVVLIVLTTRQIINLHGITTGSVAGDVAINTVDGLLRGTVLAGLVTCACFTFPTRWRP